MKRIKITESQLKLLIERSDYELSAIGLAKSLKNTPCSGDSIKNIIHRKIIDYGYRDITIKFLGYGDNRKDLIYIVHTDGPIFVVTAQSNSESNPPCMDVIDVIAYTKA